MYSRPGKHSVPRRNGSGPCALSFAQQRLWFLDQLAPGGSAYNAPVAFRLAGPLDVAALEQSLNEIARRHETLRTTFTLSEEQPVQVIAPETIVALPVADLQNYPESEREARAARLVGEEARRPFDLARGPLLRCHLWRLATEDHILLLTMHHIVSDGWSMGVLYRELSALYETFRQGKDPSLPELPIQYADFAVWQREWLRGEVLERQLSYWKRQLGGVQLLELPTDRPRSAVQSLRGTTQSFMLPKDLSEALNALSRKEGVTLFMTLLAAFQILLHRYTGQEDIAVGSPIANRTRSEIEGLIGFFVNTLVLRTDLSGSPSFRELLSRVRRAALDAYEHQDLPFEKLVEELNPERDLSHSPLFRVMLALQNAPMSPLNLSGLTVNPIEFDSGNTRFDLAVNIWDRAEGLASSFVYNADLFDGATIARMQRHFQTLLEGIVADPKRRLSELPLMPEAEQHQLLVEWNDTKTEYPKDRCLHDLFEAQAERTPDAVAVVFEDRQLTYRELNRRANQLAHHLRSLGAGPETPVGICMTCSQEMIVGLLGILKAGGAYVALDPDYPKARLAFIMEDAPLSMLLTEQRLVERIPQSGARLICLDRDWGVVSKQSEENPVTGVRPDNLAYVAYTSGSTGQPKGAMIEHGSVVNYLCWVNESLLGDRVENVPVVTKPAFDASLKQLFAPLLGGRKVWVLSENMALQPAVLLQALGGQSKVGLNCVPSLWSAALDAVECGQTAIPVESIASLLIGGEQLTKELIRRSFAALPHVRIWNIYGPTEATANASCAEILSDQEPTIGRPIANVRIYILDARLKPVPIGVPGELHIGGAGLARGYLNASDLTAEKFISDPLSAEPGARLYKTGDLARYRPDGNIEFLGRIDDQVKIRGFRIEPGEIESVLSQHPSVRDAVVLAWEQTPGDKRLVAYLVAAQTEAPAASALRDFLKARLPDYMIPSSFVFLQALPLTPNGKVNRRALPPPDLGRPELQNPFVAPRSPIEESLAKIWAQVLGLDRVGAHDNFFDLGGHSLLATQVISRVRETYQVELPVRSFFETPTVAQIAGLIQQAKADGAPSPLPKISRAPRQKVVEGSEGWERAGGRDKTIGKDAEPDAIPDEWNDTERDYPQDQCLHELFEAQVERTPDATALVFENKQLTYRDLNRRANQVAHHLRKLGVKPDGLVGLYMERSLEMVVGLLGILKAGGAYVPLDSAYPKKRLAFMLAETAPVLLLTKRPLPDDFPEFDGRAVCLDRDRELLEKEKEQNPAAAAAPDNLAYVMYTSGSTGKPKGVLIRHRGIVNYFSYLRDTYNLGSADTVLQLAPLSFDASVRDLLGPLTAGARGILVNDFDAREPSSLLSEIKKHSVTCLLSIVPTMLNALLEAARTCARVDSMRLILVSGEALHMSSCRKANEVFGPDVWIVNQYGPTETTLTCSYHRVVEADSHRGIAPVGRPIPNARMYILDSDLHRVPIGEPGELHIGGIGLARGYLNSPELTAEKFIPDPFSDEPDARLYKSGDLARYLPDGDIEFLGRLDDQVKIRGFRVELGEIEAVLAQHPGVREAAAREDAPSKRLVAYIVSRTAQVPVASDLREFLRQRLPDYMVPSSFIFLEALPLTPNGKVDRRALPAPDQRRPELPSPFVAPRNSIETTLANIWAQLLGLERVGAHDNFFDLGGHSLLATQVISRMRELYRIEISLRNFFETPTVAGLAEILEQAGEIGV